MMTLKTIIMMIMIMIKMIVILITTNTKGYTFVCPWVAQYKNRDTKLVNIDTKPVITRAPSYQSRYPQYQ